MADQCENCGAPVHDTFCARCGQAVASIDLPVADFARDMASEALGLDSRVRRTMGPLLFRPGLVAAEYVAGHRARFVPPFRLYLLTSLVMFLILSFGQLNVGTNGVRSGSGIISIGPSEAPAGNPGATDTLPGIEGGVAAADEEDGPADDVDETVDEGGGPGDIAEPVDEGGGPADENDEPADFGDRMEAGIDRLMEDPERFRDQFIGNLSRAMILLLPLFALLLKFAWWKRLYVHHFVFSMYFHAFTFIVVAVAGLPEVFGLMRLGMFADVLLLSIPVYLVLAMKRFYDVGWGGAVGKGILVYGAYGILGGSIVSAALLLSILTF